MPAYDTYHCIETFARNPEDSIAALRFYLLFRSVERDVVWKSAPGCANEEQFEALLKIKAGNKSRKTETPRGKLDLGALTKKEANDLYAKIMANAGKPVDPSIFDE